MLTGPKTTPWLSNATVRGCPRVQRLPSADFRLAGDCSRRVWTVSSNEPQFYTTGGSTAAARVVQPSRVGARATATFANSADSVLGAVRAAACECERLLKAHGVGFGTVSSRKHNALDLVEPSFVVEQRDCRMAPVFPVNAELTAVDPVDAVRDIDRHRAAFGQHPDGMVDDSAFLQPGTGQGSDRHLENDVVSADRIYARRDRAAIGDLVGRDLDLRIGRKGYRKGVVGIAVFCPALRRGGSDCYKCRENKGDQAHFRSSLSV